MGDRGIYQGMGLQQVDDKGRVAIPASLRTTLMGNNAADDMKDGPRVTVASHPKSLCLKGYDAAWAREEKDRATRLEEQRPTDDGDIDYNIKRRMSGAGDWVGFDSSGRFILPAFPRSRARIGKLAFFYGVYDYFEIWDPATLLADEAAPEIMREACRFYLTEKGIVL